MMVCRAYRADNPNVIIDSMRTISIHDGAVLSEHIFQVDVEPGTTYREFSQRIFCMENIVACFIYTGVAVGDDTRDDVDLILIDIQRGEIIAVSTYSSVLIPLLIVESSDVRWIMSWQRGRHGSFIFSLQIRL